MKLHKFCGMLMAAATAAIEACPALAQGAPDSAGPLPAPGIFGLVVLGIAAAVGIARWRK